MEATFTSTTDRIRNAANMDDAFALYDEAIAPYREAQEAAINVIRAHRQRMAAGAVPCAQDDYDLNDAAERTMLNVFGELFAIYGNALDDCADRMARPSYYGSIFRA